MISFNSSFENINVVFPHPKISYWIAASVADAAAINPKDTRTLLASGLIAFPIKGKPVFVKCQRSLPQNPTNCTILDNQVFENFILADEPFAKPLRIFETCVLVNKTLCGKLVLSLASITIWWKIYLSTIFSSWF